MPFGQSENLKTSLYYMMQGVGSGGGGSSGGGGGVGMHHTS